LKNNITHQEMVAIKAIRNVDTSQEHANETANAWKALEQDSRCV